MSNSRWKTETKSRYYMRRLWKISWVAILRNGRLVRLVKHYENRLCVGAEWRLVRSIVRDLLLERTVQFQLTLTHPQFNAIAGQAEPGETIQEAAERILAERSEHGS